MRYPRNPSSDALATLDQLWQRVVPVMTDCSFARCRRVYRPIIGLSIFIFTLISIQWLQTITAVRGPLMHEYPFESQINSTRPSMIEPLKELCATKIWDKNLVFSCYEMSVTELRIPCHELVLIVFRNGGLGNSNAFVLKCVRYAIQAGAAGLVLPQIQTRSREDISVLVTGYYEPLSYMYDVAWFRDSLRLSCPQITVYDDLVRVPNFNVARIPDRVSPLEFHGDLKRRIFNEHPETFQQDLKRHLGPDPASVTVHLRDNPTARILPPTIVRLHAKVFEYPARRDSDAFFASFGRIIRFRADVYELAARILATLRTLDLNPQDTPRFLGLHLRVEEDVTKLNDDLWPTYEKQRDYAFLEYGKRQLSLMYVACGDAEALERFRKEAANQGIKVVSKAELLEKPQLEALSRLSWDQQAMVDFLILRSSTFFIGTFPSSFSTQLAYARHLDIAKPGNSKFPFPEDAVSKINGREFEFFRWGMWPLSDKLITRKHKA